MQILINGKNTDLPDNLSASIQKRLEKLGDRYRFLQEAHVVVGKQRKWHECEVTLHVKHQILRAKERDADLGTAVDNTFDKLEKQLSRHKGRLLEHSRHTEKDSPTPLSELTVEPLEPAEDQYVPPRVVKVKRIDIKPMAVEEAALQMELLGHDFYVFVDDQSESLNVIYRRHNGDIGLIQPE
ncbi:MAG: ribosome-associated translation inhibitor RaiA [Armatimonadetes bacterium]|nr:ribosome-associated translation inhibitor RaiA [Armatimonadota bacterium]